MKSVLISIQPKWCELIASGRKTLELRKSVPKIEVPFKCYIYQTKKNWLYKILKRLPSFDWAQTIINGQTKVIGEFTCDRIMRFCQMANADMAEKQSCVRREDILEYSCGKEVFGWHISDLIIYDKPKKLSDFRYTDEHIEKVRNSVSHWECGIDDEIAAQIRRPPQSWCYVEKK